MRGNKPAPTELKILRMSGRKAEKLARKIMPTPGPLIDPPDWLTAEQKTEWAYAIANAPRNVLKMIDKSVLAGFIVAQDTHRKACIALAQSELLVKSPTQGLPLQNPYLPIVNRQLVLMARCACELGFTPCSRARIEMGKTDAPTAGGWEEIATG